MKLTLMDRLMLANLLPPEGDLRTMRVIHELRMAVGLSAEEIEAWEIKTSITQGPDGKDISQTTWNDEKVEEVEVDVAGEKTALIVEALKKLDAEKKIGPQHFGLCDKFPFGNDK